MKVRRRIVEIDQDRCTGCGLCILNCAESAIVLQNGKARVISDNLCDGLGACLAACPADALKIIEREAEPFDEEAVHQHQQTERGLKDGHAPQASACPGLKPLVRTTEAAPSCCPGGNPAPGGSGPLNWPLKLRLVSPVALASFKGKEMVLAADCAAPLHPGLYQQESAGRLVLITCPKFEEQEKTVLRLAEALNVVQPPTLRVLRVNVPCCGLNRLAAEAVKRSGVGTRLEELVLER